MKKIRWTVIGAGGLASRVAIPALKSIPQNEIVAIADTNIDSAESVAQNHAIPRYFGDSEEMFKSVECDAVYIVTPVAFHYPLVMLALKYGVNTFVEKPFAMTGEESEALLSAFREKGLQLTVGYMMGYNNLHRKTAELIKDGAIGEVTLVRMNYAAWFPDAEGAWRQKKALGGGGCIMDLAVHCMELFSSLTGEEIADVKGFFATNTFSYEVDDSAVIILRSENGILGNIDTNFNMPVAANSSGFEIFGTKGSIKGKMTYSSRDLGEIVLTTLSEPLNEKPDFVKTYFGSGESSFVKQFENFNRLLTDGTRSYENAERATNIQKLIDKIYRG